MSPAFCSFMPTCMYVVLSVLELSSFLPRITHTGQVYVQVMLASQHASTFMTTRSLWSWCARVLCREFDSTAVNAKPKNEQASPAEHADHLLTMRRWAFAQRKAWADYWNHGRWRLHDDGWQQRPDEAGRPLSHHASCTSFDVPSFGLGYAASNL